VVFHPSLSDLSSQDNKTEIIGKECERRPKASTLPKLAPRASAKGGAGAGNRTPDLLLTMEALCRLSYSGGREMIATRPSEPGRTCHHERMLRALAAASVVLSLASCESHTPVSSVILHGDRGAVQVAVEEADTPAERQQGLMGRTSLGAGEGMIFLWTDGAVTSGFWMKDTLIPLSVAFWDEDGRIVGIRDMEPCTEDPCPTYGSPKPYVGALEVNEGFFSEHGVAIGDRIDFVE
jgi:uncharacterized protein